MKVHTQRIFIVSFIFSQERIFKMWIGPTRSDHAIRPCDRLWVGLGSIFVIWSILVVFGPFRVGFGNLVHIGPIQGMRSILGRL